MKSVAVAAGVSACENLYSLALDCGRNFSTINPSTAIYRKRLTMHERGRCSGGCLLAKTFGVLATPEL